MKILVTGVKGQLGKKIVEILEKEHQLILTDYDNMDITDINAVRSVVEFNKPDYIIHGAAYTSVDKAEDNIDLCRSVNSIGTKNIAILSKEYGIKLIYISTDFVFDGLNTIPYTEKDKPNPISIYGLTKYEGEEFIKNICIQYYIIRISWLFGELPSAHTGTNFVETMIKLSKEKTNLKIINDQIGSPTYTKDLVETISIIIKQIPPFDIYHFSGNGECSWYDFAKEIFKQTNTSINVVPIPSIDYPQKAKRPPYSYLDKTKIEKTLGIKIRPWKEMLKEYLLNR